MFMKQGVQCINAGWAINVEPLWDEEPDMPRRYYAVLQPHDDMFSAKCD